MEKISFQELWTFTESAASLKFTKVLSLGFKKAVYAVMVTDPVNNV